MLKNALPGGMKTFAKEKGKDNETTESDQNDAGTALDNFDVPGNIQGNQATNDAVLDNSAKISREQFDIWRDTYLPMQSSALARAQDEKFVSGAVTEGRADARRANKLGREQRSSALHRYGLSGSGKQNRAQSERDAFKGATRETQTANKKENAARKNKERWTDMVIGQGQWMRGRASNLASQTGRDAMQRQIQQERKEAREEANKMSLAGNILGMGAGMGAMMLMSSKDTKTNVAEQAPETSMEKVRNIDVKEWEYKDGTGQPEGRHTGGMAEDMPEDMTGPNGKTVNLQSEISHLIGAVQNIDSRIQNLEGNNG